MESSALTFVHKIEPEDRARANFYGVLAALYADAPSACSSARHRRPRSYLPEAESGSFPIAWNRLVEACRVMDPDAAQQEYWDLFVGTGKSEVNLHASHWISGFMMEKPLVSLRYDLARAGAVPQAGELDGRGPCFGALRDDAAADRGRRRAPAGAAEDQKGFFERHIDSWVPDLCTALTQTPLANFYRPVGEFTELFVAIERDSFAIG